MGYIVPLYHPLRLAEEIAIVDQMLGGRMELGSFPASIRIISALRLDYSQRKSPTLEFVDYLRAAFGIRSRSPSMAGVSYDLAEISVQAVAATASALWMMSRDPQTLEFCAKNAISPLFFGLSARRCGAALPQVSRRLDKRWLAEETNIAYCSIVYVDDTDEKAIENALFRASRAYEGFLEPPRPGETFEQRAREHAKKFIGRGEPGASEIMQHLFDANICWSTIWSSSARPRP